MNHPIFNGHLLLITNNILYAIAVAIFFKLQDQCDFSGLIFGLVYASFLEYLLHRFLFHSPLDKASRLHWIHHKAFTTSTMAFRNTNEWHMILYSPATTLMILIICFGHFTLLYMLNLPILASSVSIAILMYFFLYEWLHLGFHTPSTLIRKIWVLKRLRHLHLRHHRVHIKGFYGNFNVVLPLWDILLGTFKGR